METSTVIVIIFSVIGFLIGFAIYWSDIYKHDYNDFFTKKDVHEDFKTHIITETVREKTFINKVRAILYVILKSIWVGIAGAGFLGGSVVGLIEASSRYTDLMEKNEYEEDYYHKRPDF